MALNLVQFLAALQSSTCSLSAQHGIVTFEDGDIFIVADNAQALQTLLMSASVDLKDAHEQLVQFSSSLPDDKPYYHETREQLVAVRRGLEAIDMSGAKPMSLDTGIRTDMAVLASAFKDVVNAAQTDAPYTFADLSGASFAQAIDVMSKYDPDNPEQPSQEAETPSQAATELTNLTVSTDGGLTFQPAPHGVRMAYGNIAVPGQNRPGELYISASQDSVIMDIWSTSDVPFDNSVGSSCQLVTEIVERLVKDNE